MPARKSQKVKAEAAESHHNFCCAFLFARHLADLIPRICCPRLPYGHVERRFAPATTFLCTHFRTFPTLAAARSALGNNWILIRGRASTRKAGRRSPDS